MVRNLKMINAVAAPCHADTPPTINQRRPAEPHTLKIKLRACWQMMLVGFAGVTVGSDLIHVGVSRRGMRVGSW